LKNPFGNKVRISSYLCQLYVKVMYQTDCRIPFYGSSPFCIKSTDWSLWARNRGCIPLPIYVT